MADGKIYTNTIVLDDQVMGTQHLEETEALIEAWDIVVELTGQSVLDHCSDLITIPCVEKWSKGTYTLEEMAADLYGTSFNEVVNAISEVILDLDTVAYADICNTTTLY